MELCYTLEDPKPAQMLDIRKGLKYYPRTVINAFHFTLAPWLWPFDVLCFPPQI